MNLLSEVRHGALLAYSPRGTRAVSVQSRTVCSAIKRADPAYLARAMDLFQERFESAGFGQVLGPHVIVVPAPRSAPLVNIEALWPSRRICELLVDRGLALGMRTYLSRTVVVQKSAWSKAGQRPSIETHYDSIALDRTLESHAKITVVDDVVTKGATLLASASRLAAAFQSIEIEAFALIRTRGLVPDVEKIVDPVLGTISLLAGQLNRSHD